MTPRTPPYTPPSPPPLPAPTARGRPARAALRAVLGDLRPRLGDALPRPLVGALVHRDPQHPPARATPEMPERVHAGTRGLLEAERHRAALAVHDPLGGAGGLHLHRQAVVEDVHQEGRAARGLVPRVGGELDRDPRGTPGPGGGRGGRPA